MIEIEWQPSKDFHEALRVHLMDRGMAVIREGIAIGKREHEVLISEWNHVPDIDGMYSRELYQATGQLHVVDKADSWWWLVNDGGSTMPKGGGILLPKRARALEIADYDSKTDGGSGSRYNIVYRGAVFGPRLVEARDMLGKVEQIVTPMIIDMARRKM